jgi:hypothetical protein
MGAGQQGARPILTDNTLAMWDAAHEFDIIDFDFN